MTLSSSDLNALLSPGVAASQRGDSMGAISLWAQVADDMPSWAMPPFLMASEYAALGEMGKAQDGFAKAVLLAPDLLIARYQLGLLQFSCGQVAMAFLTWEPLLALDEQSPFPHFVRGFSALAQDAFEEARRSFEAGLALNLDNEALSADIQKVIQEIDRLSSSVMPGPTEGMTVEESDGEASHVLLSNYFPQGPSH